jgi:GNAT superfamily N-acetyltransferase
MRRALPVPENNMHFTAKLTTLRQIVYLRDLYRKEMNCQIIHDSIHSRPGWTLEYSLCADDELVGYGSVAIGGPWKASPVIYEFFVQRESRSYLFNCFLALCSASGVNRIETQSNDVLLTSMLHTFASDVKVESILFRDEITTTLSVHGAAFRNATAADLPEITADQLPAHGVIVLEGAVIAKGGILFHYNRPYGDIYMEVSKLFRKRGFGSFLVQNLKRVCYELGSVPAARCSPTNIASRQTLQKAGLVPCGHILTGVIASNPA